MLVGKLSFLQTIFSKKLTQSAIISAFFITGIGGGMSAHAGSMYVFKDSNGQALLTNVVHNNHPVGDNFQRYNQKVKVTYYADSNVHSYHNYGGNEAAVPKSGSSNRNSYDALIVASAMRHGVDPALMKAMMHTESGFNPYARSPVGAQGLMQLMPATARRFSVINAWNPSENIEGAAKYLQYLQTRFGNIQHVMASYNAGEGNVSKYGGVPPFRETRDYVQRVLSRYNNLYRNDPNLRSNLQTASYNPAMTYAIIR